MEHFLCVRGKNETKWTCIEGMYERFYGTEPHDQYEYDHITTYKLPTNIKKRVFENKYKDHELVLNYIK